MSTQVTNTTQEVMTEHVEPERIVRVTTKVVEPDISREPQRQEYKTKKAIFRTYQLVWYILGVIEILLVFRFFLRLLGANPASGFTDFIYTLSSPLTSPFLGVVPASISGTSAMEWSTLLAMGVYFVLAWLIVEFLQMVKPVNPDEVEQVVDTTYV